MCRRRLRQTRQTAFTVFTAAGDISSSTVQAAIEELDTEKLAKAVAR